MQVEKPVMPKGVEQEGGYKPESPEVQKKIYLLFRDYFDRAEKKRRWSIRDDIPWDQCNPSLNPADRRRRGNVLRRRDVSARLPQQADPAGAGQPRPGLDAGQLGLRGVEALDGVRRLAAAVADAHRRADGRPGKDRLLPRVAAPVGQRPGHGLLHDDAGGGDLAPLPEPAANGWRRRAATRRWTAPSSWSPSTSAPITISSAGWWPCTSRTTARGRWSSCGAW